MGSVKSTMCRAVPLSGSGKPSRLDKSQLLDKPQPSEESHKISSKPSYCFSTASALLQDKQISWEEYLHHCLMHFVDGFPTHEEDIDHGSPLKNQELLASDPFAHALWCWQSQAFGIKDVSQLEAVFQAYDRGLVDDLKSRLAPLEPEPAQTMRRALAFLALEDRKLDILSYILSDGQTSYDPPISSAFKDRALAVRGVPETELFQVIYFSPWMRHVRLSAKAQRVQGGAPPGREADFQDIPW